MTTSDNSSTQGRKRSSVHTGESGFDHPQKSTEQGFSDGQQSFELEGVTPEPLLFDYVHKLYSTNTLAPALLAAQPVDHLETYRKLSQCADNVTVKPDGSVYHHARCNLRICPLCSAITARKRQARAKAVIRSKEALFRLAGSDDNPSQAHKLKTHAICLGLNLGQRCELYEIREYVKALNATWTKFYKVKAVRDFVAGYHRVAEVALEASEATMSAHAHFHITLLIDASDPKLTLESALTYAESTLIPIWVNKAREVIKSRKLDTVIKATGQKAFPLDAQNMGELGAWLSYCLKGVVNHEANKLRKTPELTPAQHADAWLALGSQLKHQHLISDGGLFKESRQAYDRAEELRKLDREAREAEADQVPSSTFRMKRMKRPPKVTHRWSHPSSRWKRAEEYDPDLDCDPEALLRGLYLRVDRDKLFAIIREMRLSQKRAIDEAQLIRAKDEASEDRWKIAYWLSTGKRPPKSPKDRGKRQAS